MLFNARLIELFRYIVKILTLIVLYPISVLPIKSNRIILDNGLAHNYSDSAKVIANYLVEKYKEKYEILLSVHDEGEYSYLLKMGIVPIRFHSVKYFIKAITSSVFITNSGGYSYLPLSKKCLVINTWHGLPYKRIGIDAYGVSNFYKKELKLAEKKLTYFISSSRLFTDIVSKALIIPRSKFIEIGSPRNDILLRNDDDIKKKIKEKIGIDSNQKLVLYAPTYRKYKKDTFGKSIAELFDIDYDVVCQVLSDKFEGNWIFSYRCHPCTYKSKRLINTLDLTYYEDMQELLLIADILITDFSSCMFDFMLTKKPIFLFAPDVEDYIQTTALYPSINELPFSMSKNILELCNNISTFDSIKYYKSCEIYYKSLECFETGKSTDIVCRIIDKHINNKESTL